MGGYLFEPLYTFCLLVAFLQHAERALVYALCWSVQLLCSFLVIAKRRRGRGGLVGYETFQLGRKYVGW